MSDIKEEDEFDRQAVITCKGLKLRFRKISITAPMIAESVKFLA